MGDSHLNDKVKLILTKPAIERLIGGDAEAEVALKSSTIKTIIQKHFIPLVTNKVLEDAALKIREAVNKEIESEFGENKETTIRPNGILSRSFKKVEFRISSKIKNKLKSLIDGEIDNIIKEKIHEVCEKIDSKIDKITDEEIRKIIKEKVSKIYG